MTSIRRLCDLSSIRTFIFSCVSSSLLTVVGLQAASPPPSLAGTIVYSRGGSPDGTVWFASGDGSADIFVTTGEWPRVSHDGRYLLFHRGNPTYSRADVWVRDLSTGVETKVYANNDYVVSADWSLDATQIFFDYSCDIRRMNRDGSGIIIVVPATDCYDDAPAVNPVDGRLTFHNIHSGLWIAAPDGSGRTKVANTTGGATPEAYPVWSPDGTKLAFQLGSTYGVIGADGSGRTDLLGSQALGITRPLPDAPAAWSADGRWVLFGADLNGTNGLFAVAADASGTVFKLQTSPGDDITYVGGVYTNLHLSGTASLSLSLTPSASPAAVGQAFQLIASVRNGGPAPATNTVVTNALPAGLRLVNATTSQGSAASAAGQVVAHFGTVAPGTTANLTLTLVATNADFLSFSAVASQATPSLNGPQSAATTVLAVVGTAGVIAHPGERDSYSFHLGARAQYYFDSLVADNSGRWTLTGPGGVLIDHRQLLYSDGNEIGDPYVVLNLVPGDYLLTINGDADSTPVYAFNFVNLASAPLLTLGSDTVANLVPGTSTLMWQFPAKAGDQVQLHALGKTNLSYPSWRLVNPLGTVIFHNSLSDSPALTLAGDGTYTLMIEGDIGSTGVGSCGFNVSSLGHIPPVPPSGTPITLGALISDNLPDATTNHYQFTLTNSATLVFDTQTNRWDIQWEITGPFGVDTGVHNFRDIDGDRGNPLLFLPAGSYGMTVWGYNGATGPYAFRLLNAAAATPINRDTPVAGTLNPANATDMYAFTVPAGTRLFLDASNTNRYDTYWRLIDPDGGVVFTQGLNTPQGPLTLTIAGTYTLLIEGDAFEAGTMDYSFTVLTMNDGNQALSLGATVNGAVTQPGQLQHYSFTLAAPTPIYVDALTNTSALTWSLDGPTGRLADRRDFRSTDGDRGLSTFWLPAGDFVITVAAYGDQIGNYSFRVFALASATPLSLDTQVSGTLNPASKTDAYRFSLASPTRLFFDTTPNPRGDAYWRLLDSLGTVLFTQSLSYPPSPMTLPSGSYTLLIEGDVYETGSMDYSFRVATVHDGNASLSIGTTVTGAISGPGQVQRYTFSLTGTNFLYFDSLTNVDSLTWSLDGPAGNIVNQRDFRSSDGQRGFSAFSLMPGAYTVSVAGSGDATRSFSFRLFDLSTATPISLDTPVSGTLNPANRTDAYRFTVAAPTRLFLDNPANARGSAYWRLLDPYGNLVFGQQFNSPQGPLSISAVGTYTLLIEGDVYETGTMDYSFQIISVVDGAQSASLGATVKGAITEPGQAQRFSFTLNTAKEIYFDSLTNSPNAVWSLDGPTGNIVNQRPFTGSDGNRGLSLLNLPPGSYTITVTAYSDIMGPFSFRLLDLASASPFATDQAVSGTLNPAQSTDLYQFTATAGDRFTFHSLGSSSGNTFWRLVDPFGQVLFSTYVNTDQGPLTLNAPGHYTILVEGDVTATAGTPYSFQLISQGNVPPTPFTGTPITLGQIIQGNSATNTATNSYTFTLSQATTVVFDVLSTPGNFSWSLHGPPGLIVDRAQFYYTDSNGQPTVWALPAGNYEVDISGDTGSFSYRILDLATATPLALGTPVTGTNTPAIAMALYRFTATAGQALYFAGSTPTGFNGTPRVWILSPFGTPAANFYVYENQKFAASAPGTYSVLVTEPPYDISASGVFSFNILPIVNATNTLALGATISGTISSPGQKQFYTFTLATRARLSFDLLSYSDSLRISLLGPDGLHYDRSYAYYLDYNGSATFTDCPAGNYLVTLDSDSPTTIPYQFRLLDSATAQTFTPGQQVVGTNAPANATGLFAFNALAGNEYFYYGTGRTGFVNYRPTFTLFGPSGERVFSAGIDDQTGPFFVPENGRYVAYVGSPPQESGTNGTYGFIVIPVTNSTNAMTLGSTVNSAISIPGQTQAYTFSLGGPRRVHFDTLSALTQLNWSLTGPRGTVVNNGNAYYSDTYAPTPWFDLEAGDYLLTLSISGAMTNPMPFRLLDFAAATPFLPGQTVTVPVTPANGTTLLRFDAQAGDSFYFNSLGSSGFSSSPVIALSSPLGQKLFSIAGTQDQDDFVVPQTGTYTLLIMGRPDDTGSAGTYSFNLVPVPPASPIALFNNLTAPDLIVTQVTPTPGTGLHSGQSLTVAWQVKNSGNSPVASSFTDRVTVRNPSTGELLVNHVFFDDASVNGPLNPGTTRNRSVGIQLPDGPSASGNLEVAVTTDALNNVQEQNADGTAEANNSLTTGITVALAPYPDLRVTKVTASPAGNWSPGATVTVTWVLSNAGSGPAKGPWTDSLAVRNVSTSHLLASFATNETAAAFAPGASLTNSTQVVLPNDANAYGQIEFDLTTDSGNDVFEYLAGIDAEANNVNSLVVLNLAPGLTLSVSTNRIPEGGSLTATVQRQPVSSQPLTVILSSSDQTRLSAPGTVTIAANSASATFPVTAPDDTYVEGTNTFTLTASAAGFNPGAASVTVEEHDFPTVTLSLAAHTISEAAGPNATSATLTRSIVTSHTLIVSLTSGNPAAVHVPSVVVIPANQASASFPIAVVDDGIVTGTRAVAIGGSILDDITQQPLAPIVPDVLSVTDADGPTLQLQLASTLVREGLSPATTATVTRNTDTSAALVVTVSSSDTDAATAPATVTIPAGSASATFPVASIFDASKSGNRPATLTASASGFTAGTAVLIVTDVNLPDLVVSSISFPTNGVTGGTLPVTFRLENRGLKATTNSFSQRVFISTDNLAGGDVVSGQVQFSGSLPAGQFVDQTANITLPTTPGTYWFVVVADVNNEVVEVLKDNNTTVSTRAVNLQPNYTASVSTTVHSQLAGQPVPLTGQATLAGGGAAAFVPVTVHIEVRGIHRTLDVVTDGNGRFNAVFTPLPTEAGHYHIAASYPGLPMPAAQGDFVLLGFQINPVGLITVVQGSSTTNSTLINNLSEVPLTGLTVEVVTNHHSLSVSASLDTNNLAGNGQATLTFVVTTVDSSAIQSPVVLQVTSAEGASETLVVTVRQQLLTPTLAATPSSLASGMVRGRQTTTTFKVTNNGGIDTGHLEILTPNVPWLSVTAPAQIDSLPPGSNTVVTVLLTPAPDLPLGDYNGSLVLRSTNSGLSVPYSFVAVSDQKGDLSITVEDEYTYFAAGGPHVTNALIVLTDALTGVKTATNQTDANGVALFHNLIEATYVADVTADAHTGNRGTIAVVAGTLTSKTVFLPRETVHYTFTVQPTTVQDQYTLQVDSTFETQVPIPVVTVDPPSIDLSSYQGTEFQFQITVANHGLIAADSVKINLPSAEHLQLTPLITDLGKLPANSSLTIPILAKRLLPPPVSTQSKVGLADYNSGTCSVTGSMLWNYLCGPNVVDKSTAFYAFDSTGCDLVALYRQVYDLVPDAGGGGGGGGGTLTSDGFFDYLEQLNPVTDFEAPPGYHFQCKASPPVTASVGGRTYPASRPGVGLQSVPPSTNLVCAKVTLRLDQRAVLTRDAFKATLDLGNDTPDPLSKVLVNLEIKDQNSQVANSIFGVQVSSVTGFSGIDGTGTLPGQSQGTASWILVPTLDASPTNGSTLYLVGGTLSYSQNGIQVTVPIAPAPIQVFPQPELIVRYFHDRDVFADDPFTPQIEPSIPYSLAAQILNVGYGAARNLKLASGKPEIVDNIKGLLIDFKTIGTQLENTQLSPSLDVDFGQIDPGTNRIARWLFQSSVQGSFTNFSASFQQVDNFGNPRTSLLRKVEIHELSHIVDASGPFEDYRPDFLAVNTPGSDHYPDTLYLSDGTTNPVTVVTDVGLSGTVSDTNKQVTVTANVAAGFVYFRLPDPAGSNAFTLTRVLRGDGTDLGVGTNAWTTDRFFRGGDLRPIYTNQVHLFDYNSSGTYTLIYTPTGAPPADTTPPTSSVAALPANSSQQFTVNWSGSDAGTGIAYYDIYLSVNSGPFSKWLSQTTLNGSLYDGQIGSHYAFYSVATDVAGNVETAPASAQAQTTVSVVNTPPTISLGPKQTISQGDTLTLTSQVHDSDLPAQTFSFDLLAAPAGVLLNPNTGSLIWVTSVADGPSTNSIQVRVTDSGTPPLSATGVVSVVVRSVNTAPSLAPIADQVVKQGDRLTVAVGATDTDQPAQTLSFALAPGAPSGATIDPATGIFTWQPAFFGGPSTNQITVTVTDNGSPPLSASRTFTVVVRKAAAAITLTAGRTNVVAGASSSVPLSLEADTDLTDLTFTLQMPTNYLSQLALQGLASDVVSASLAPTDATHSQIHFTLAGTAVNAKRQLGVLSFTALATAHSGNVPLTIGTVAGHSTLHTYDTGVGQDGLVVVVGAEPVLLALPAPSPTLVLFGTPGTAYQIDSSPTIAPVAVWSLYQKITLSTNSHSFSIDPSAGTIYFRALKP